MNFYLLIEGMIIGLLASAPPGPVSFIVIQRTIQKSRKDGFYSGLGIALSDTIYALLAGFSVAFVFQLIKEYNIMFKIAAYIILLSIGFFFIFSKTGKKSASSENLKKNHFKRFLSAFLLTASNPLVLFLYFALFSAFGLALSIKNPMEAIVVMAGFIIGAVVWWFSITGLINRFREKFSMKMCMRINRAAGFMIILLILVSLVSFLFF